MTTTANETASLEVAEQRWQITIRGEDGERQAKLGRLQKAFGGLRATNITTEALNR